MIKINGVSRPVGVGGVEGSFLVSGPFREHFLLRMFFAPAEAMEITEEYHIVVPSAKKTSQVCKRLSKHFAEIAARADFGVAGLAFSEVFKEDSTAKYYRERQEEWDRADLEGKAKLFRLWSE